MCEQVTVGSHGSPGAVRNDEILHSVLIAPADWANDQIAITMVTHAERKGMSVLRGGASDDEFRETIRLRLRDDYKRYFHGVASMQCKDVRALTSPVNSNDPLRRSRLYCVFDTDIDGRPHHADIFATMHPDSRVDKHARKAVRRKILDMLTQGLSSPAEFRGGALRNID